MFFFWGNLSSSSYRQVAIYNLFQYFCTWSCPSLTQRYVWSEESLFLLRFNIHRISMSVNCSSKALRGLSQFFLKFVFSINCSKHNHYRPQRSWGKVIFSEACVKNSVCMAQEGHAWQGVCMVGKGACMTGGMNGRGACMAGGHVWWGVWQEGGVCGRYYEIRSMSGRYASYWNAHLFCTIFVVLLLHRKNDAFRIPGKRDDKFRSCMGSRMQLF